MFASTAYTHHMYRYPCVHTVCWNSCICVCLSTLRISPISKRILAAVLFKPLCPSCATSTTEQPFLYSLSVCYIVHTMHMVFGLRAALEIRRVVVSVFFFPTPFLCRHNSLPRALCFISLSLWWIPGCHAEMLTLSIIVY